MFCMCVPYSETCAASETKGHIRYWILTLMKIILDLCATVVTKIFFLKKRRGRMDVEVHQRPNKRSNSFPVQKEIPIIVDFGFIDCEEVYLALYGAEQAECLAHLKLSCKFILVPLLLNDSACSNAIEFEPSCLAEIYRFDAMLRSIKRRNSASRIIVSAGIESLLQMKSVFLMGCHLIMTQGKRFVDLSDIFWNFLKNQVRMWRALMQTNVFRFCFLILSWPGQYKILSLMYRILCYVLYCIEWISKTKISIEHKRNQFLAIFLQIPE